MSLNILSLAIICLLLIPQLSASFNVSGPAVADSASGLKKFNSTDELKEYLQKNTLMTRNIEYGCIPIPSLYIGNVLYTISSQKIVMSDLNDLGEPIGEVGLTGQGVIYGPTDGPVLIE